MATKTLGKSTERPGLYTENDTKTDAGGSGTSSAYLQLLAQREAAAQNAYNKNMGILNDAYAKRGDLLKKNYDDTIKQLQGQYDYGVQQVNQSADRAQQQAYINYMMSKRDLPQQLAAMGLTGGASESRLAGLYNNYGNARNEVDVQRNGDLADLMQTLNQNKSAALQNYNDALAEDAARKMAYQMELEQALANQQADIAQDRYSALASLDSGYTGEMGALVENQEEQAGETGQYTVGNDPALVAQQQGTMIRNARNAYAAAIRTGMSESEALNSAIGLIYDEAAASGMSASDLVSMANQFRGMVR